MIVFIVCNKGCEKDARALYDQVSAFEYASFDIRYEKGLSTRVRDGVSQGPTIVIGHREVEAHILQIRVGVQKHEVPVDDLLYWLSTHAFVSDSDSEIEE